MGLPQAGAEKRLIPVPFPSKWTSTAHMWWPIGPIFGSGGVKNAGRASSGAGGDRWPQEPHPRSCFRKIIGVSPFRRHGSGGRAFFDSGCPQNAGSAIDRNVHSVHIQIRIALCGYLPFAAEPAACTSRRRHRGRLDRRPIRRSNPCAASRFGSTSPSPPSWPT